jgi:hypothetical protein
MVLLGMSSIPEPCAAATTLDRAERCARDRARLPAPAWKARAVVGSRRSRTRRTWASGKPCSNQLVEAADDHALHPNDVGGADGRLDGGDAAGGLAQQLEGVLAVAAGALLAVLAAQLLGKVSMTGSGVSFGGVCSTLRSV